MPGNSGFAPGLRVTGVLLILGLTAGCSAAEGPASTPQPGTAAVSGAEPTVTGELASGLDAPWSMAQLADGGLLVTERDTADVLLVQPDGRKSSVGTIAGVVPAGEGGLLGIALPDPAADTVFVYFTAADDNRVVRLDWDGSRLSGQRDVLTGIPKGTIHNGGRIAFGPDGFLYVATGEIGQPDLAQDRTTMAGKILRITRAGEAAPGNPWPGSPIWSYGHRNVQGLAWDAEGRLWASEFGQNDVDELNLIRPGDNYGWPMCEGPCSQAGLTDPKATWSPTSTASPSGLAIANGSAWVAALRGETLYEIPLRGTSADPPVAWFSGQFGRLRDVINGTGTSLLVMTNNTDGRGSPGDEDDRILQVEPPAGKP